MPAQVHHLPAPHTPSAVEPDRGGWGALRAELHGRCADHDLAALWSDMNTSERKAVLASARMEPRDALIGIERMAKADREAIRGAIRRMSQYALRLRDRLETAEPAACQLARNARQAMLEGDRQAALHWLNLIEQGAA